MKYQLFISDFDGTLVRGDGTISTKTKEAIARYRARGGTFAVCTGRMLPSIMPRLAELGLTEGLVVAFQGATICDVKTGALIKDDAFSEEAALPLICVLERLDCHFHVYTVDRLIANMRDEMLDVYEKLSGMTAEVVTEERISEKVKREKLRIVKTLVMLEPEARDELVKRLEEELGAQYYVTSSHPWMVEVMPCGQSKGEAVQFLSRYYGIPRENIAAVGDERNDLPMLQAAGGRYTVENGADVLKEIAQTVPSNEDDGVAYLLERILEENE